MQAAAIVLAAGAATRMGRAKQLLRFRGTTLVQRAAVIACTAGFSPTVVVIGAEGQAIRGALTKHGTVIVENPRWEVGMGSSVAVGVHYLQAEAAGLDAIAILLADQPLVDARHLSEMLQLLVTSNADIVAARYSGAMGVPALFRRALFPALARLDGETGARSLLRNPDYAVLPFDLPEAAVDVDTPDDFAALPNNQ